MQISDILQKTSGKLAVTDEAVLSLDIRRVAPLDCAVKGDLSFLTNIAHLDKARTTAASAILVAAAVPELSVPQIITPQPLCGDGGTGYAAQQHDEGTSAQS